MVESIYQQICGEAAMNAAVAGHLQDTLKELGVPESIAGEIMSTAASKKGDVRNQ